MPEVDIRMNPFLAEALTEMVQSLVRGSEEDGLIHNDFPVEDSYMRELWREGLLEEEEKDATQLLHLLHHQKFGRKAVPIEEEAAEAILRSCSAVRLRILNLYLNKVPAEELEGGQLDPQELSSEQQRGYACYLFLASLQSLLINQLYPDIEEY